MQVIFFSKDCINGVFNIYVICGCSFKISKFIDVLFEFKYFKIDIEKYL